ncbi:DUF6268 family outer membrane beta-barrel protein [Shewanella sp. 10N.286.51.B2]|uniref:DUF6268 family outer membrane beta-barrel protein n=1 Tax=unclassified Shewanella TaxID=196818 RepID=UPI001054C9E1|nr:MULTISPECIES: DUF6268 family outer membrane beta-barrel protein [unclassified Shewanella]MDO6618552.1 DUF6268 family outer membrane beta-barrel protein [Shewanella sp. 6_MG-2023]MDO6641774.1 DUF6268 family outer membrane beta-barrel protein [Shewanella sp. 5_MG-2023]MDO6678481.1 DUF6268 family outer membrane beta-barrel protein [Shewanella sp. 4_MG-2023]
MKTISSLSLVPEQTAFEVKKRYSKRLSIPYVAKLAAVSSLAFSATASAYDYSPFKFHVSRTSTEAAQVGSSDTELQRDVWRMKLSASMPIGKEWSIGANVGYDNLDYGFKNVGAGLLQGNVTPWSSINKYSAGLSLSYRPNAQWMFLFAPKLQYSYANTASSSDAQSYGVVASGMYRFKSGNMLGVGVAYLNDISEVKTIPYLAVKWNITDKLSLSNPFQAGFSGPAGLELSYKLDDKWNFGLGASRRTERFLVTDAEQTIEVEEWVSFIRAGWNISKKVSINAYGGYFFAGEMELSQPKVSDDIENQAAAGLAIDIKF